MGLKVLGLVTDAFGGRGGIAAVTRDVAMALAENSATESICLLARNGGEKPSPRQVKLVQQVPSLGKAGFVLAALWHAVRLRPDFVYCSHLHLAPLAGIVARLAGARLVVHLHGIEIWDTPTYWRRCALEAADLLLCVSRHTRGHLLRSCDIVPERAVVLNNTVGEQFKPGDRSAARRKLGVEGKRVLLTVGRIAANERYKGQDAVLEALPGLQERCENLLYLIAGDGDDLPRLRAKAAILGISGQVRFLGHVDAADLPDLYRAADLYVMPSTGEGFGLAFVEAMACGTPALGLAQGGAVDALGDGALGTASDAAAFDACLAKAVNARHAAPAQLSQAVEKRFGREIFADRLTRHLALLNA